MRRIIGAVALVAIAAAGCADENDPGAGARATKLIEVVMTDNAFRPTTVTVPKGEQVVLTFVNSGSVQHEATIGDDAVQNMHAEEMKETDTMPGMDHVGGRGGERTVTVKPGQSGEITSTFDEAETLIIGCHEPGHYDGGMRATLRIT